MMNFNREIEPWLKPRIFQDWYQCLDKSWTAKPLFNTTPMLSFDQSMECSAFLDRMKCNLEDWSRVYTFMKGRLTLSNPIASNWRKFKHLKFSEKNFYSTINVLLQWLSPLYIGLIFMIKARKDYTLRHLIITVIFTRAY